jgi:heme oxygenase
MTRTSTMSNPQHRLDPEPGASVCEQLRHATHAAHVRINRHPYLCGLIKAGYPLAQYQTLLAMYTALYAAVEAQVESFISRHNVTFDYRRRRKTEWLRDDVVHFGLNLLAPPWQPPELPALLAVADRGALIGTLYVIEGATLGGELIARHLQVHLELGPSCGARFFNGYGDALTTRDNWQAFCGFANSIDTDRNLQASAKVSAVHVFALIERQLDALQARSGAHTCGLATP